MLKTVSCETVFLFINIFRLVISNYIYYTYLYMHLRGEASGKVRS